MAEILVVTGEVPLPLQANGLSLRLNPVLRYLAARHAVDLMVLGDPRHDAAALLEDAGDLCREAFLVERPRVGRLTRWARTLAAMVDPRRPPWEGLDPATPEFVGALTDLASRRSYDVVLGLARIDAFATFADGPAAPPRMVLDWVDAPSLHHERAWGVRGPVARWVGRCRTRRLVRWQQGLNARLDAAIYIAQTDRDHAGEATNRRVAVVGNGVLDSGCGAGAPRPSRRPVTIGFLGNMAYGPNVLAARRLHDRIFPLLSRDRTDLRLKIVGRDPAPEIRRLASDRVEVTGEVESIWPHLAEVAVMVFPMELGGGLQNKVLEAIAGGCAVVVTRVGAAGAGPLALRNLLVEDTDEGMAAAVGRLLDAPDELAEARRRARALLDHFDWQTILPRYERVLLGRRPTKPAPGPPSPPVPSAPRPGRRPVRA